MGRYLRGDRGFSYKYVYAEQAANLRSLARASRAGTARMEPALSVSMDELERTDDLPVMELLREAVRRTGTIGPALDVVLSRADAIPPAQFDALAHAVAETIVPLAAIVDEQLPAVAQHVMLAGRASYIVTRDDHARLLAYVGGFLGGRALQLDDLRREEAVETAALALGDADDYLALLALRILAHAVCHDLPTMTVAESMPETIADELWSIVRDESGPPILTKRDPATRDEWFARGLVSMWACDRDDAVRALRRCGDARVRRWLVALGEPAPAELVAHVAGARHDDVLERFLLAEDIGDRWAQEPGLALAKLHELLLAHPTITREAARGIVARKVLAYGNELAAAAAALPPGVARDAALDEVSARRLESLAGELSTLLHHGSAEDLRRAYDSASALVELDGPVPESPLAYNLACAAARLGDKPAMLAWLRVAKLAGDHPRDALGDSDFAAFHGDAELAALAAED